jgi:hypothetical protein
MRWSRSITGDAAEWTFGYRREDVLGRELAELVIPQEFREAHRCRAWQDPAADLDDATGLLRQREELERSSTWRTPSISPSWPRASKVPNRSRSLLRLGCRLDQGFYFARPLEPRQLESFLRADPVSSLPDGTWARVRRRPRAA